MLRRYEHLRGGDGGGAQWRAGTPTEDGAESSVNPLAVVRNTTSPLAGQKSHFVLAVRKAA